MVGEAEAVTEATVSGVVGQRLMLEAFRQLAGSLAGQLFVKCIVDHHQGVVHFVSDESYKFHSDYIAEKILGIPLSEMLRNIDEYNQSFYRSTESERRFYLGILA